MLRIRKFGVFRCGYNARAFDSRWSSICDLIDARATPQTKNAKVMHEDTAALWFMTDDLEWRLSVSTFENNTCDSPFAKSVVSEIDDKAKRNVHQLHIRKQLGFMTNHINLILVKRFAFDNQTLVDETIKAKLLLECEALVSNRNDNLCLRLMASHSQFLRQGHLIDVFEHSDTEMLLHFNRSFNDFTDECISSFECIISYFIGEMSCGL